MNTAQWIDFVVSETETALALLYSYMQFQEMLSSQDNVDQINKNSEFWMLHNVSPTLISKVTDALIEQVVEWQYNRRTAGNTLDFIDCVIEEMPFPVQRFQTDRGREFFAEKVQKRLMEYGFKFRPNKPGSPHLNGKVERSQKTDKAEFYATVDLAAEDLNDQLALWQHYYNWDRPHSAHNGKTPNERFIELINETPFYDDVSDNYQPTSERIQDANYRLDLELQRLKRSL